MTKDLSGCKIYLKREDLNHTGAHKINNVLGQILLAQKMGKRIFIVVEKLNELEIIAKAARKFNVKPNLGIRIKLASSGSGKWEDSGGDASKFGLTSSELLKALTILDEKNLHDSLRLIHFHIGSQITKIRHIQTALREAAQFYVQLHKMGYNVDFVDCGGGLGVDYDGTRSPSSESSVNYSILEYVKDCIYTIVDAANSVIVRNSRRMEKHCFSAGDVGEPIRILKAYTDREEAEMVVSDLRDKVRSTGDDWSEAVILYRTNNQSAVLEDNLRRRGIPYRIYKGSSFYDHKEVKDVLAYIRLVINPRDDEAFKRIVNYPTRGIGDTTVQRIAQLAAERGVSMWEAVDALVAEPAADAVQRAIARKAADFVAMIRSLSLARNDKGLYDFGLEIASRSGILAAYRAENTPEAASALDNIEELLNSMQEFRERCDAEIRNGERSPGEEATIEEWLQQMMLMTDMDKDDPEDRNKVTLMTVHSAKGLEYKYVYIVGLEENLFPSQRAAESPDGMEEERRLFYVALTRAKVEATISYAEMRFKWGNMEFSRPSCFLREIDPKYVRADFGTGADDDRPHRSPDGSAPSAIDELRRRFDYRFQQKQQAAGGNNPGSGGGRPGINPGRGNFGGRPSDGESGPARRFARAAAPRDARPQGRPDPALVQAPRPSTDGMRRIGVRQAADGGVPLGDTMPVSGDYTVGQRVEHPKFGVGIVQRIETLATDHKLVVAFDGAGEKTLLAKFAKLTKLG